MEGPFELIELAGLLRSQHINGETPLCSEGTEQWINFKDRPEYAFAQEIPDSAIQHHMKEQAAESESSWSPKRLLYLVWLMAPVFLYVLYRFVRMYIEYHMTHDS